MAISRSKSTPVAAQPLGTSSLIFGGLANNGGYNYTSSLSSGSYLLYLNSTNTSALYSVEAPNSRSTVYITPVSNGNSNVIRITTTESNFGIAQYAVWTTQASGLTGSIYGSAAGNGIYMVGATGGQLSTSTDGITWTTRNAEFGTTAIYDIAFGNGVFVAVGGSGATGVVRTSTDGITWTSRTNPLPAGGNLRRCKFIEGNFYLLNESLSNIATSTDGITWTTRDSKQLYPYGIAYEKSIGLYMICNFGNAGQYSTSTDGITWTSRSISGEGGYLTAMDAGNGVFVTFWYGSSGFLRTSTNGTTWTAQISSAGYQFNEIKYANGIFVAGGTNLLTTSTNGVSWTTRSTAGLVAANVRTISFGNGLFIAGQDSGNLVTAPVATQIALYATAGARLN
jgi:hypothetical protein